MGVKAIFCHQCNERIKAQFVRGAQVYPHRQDLVKQPYWQCPQCKCFVGCHPNSTAPLGVIVGPKIKRLRAHIHEVLDPIWQSGTISRSKLYCEIADQLGWEYYHTANVYNEEIARQVLAILDTYEIKMAAIEE